MGQCALATLSVVVSRLSDNGLLVHPQKTSEIIFYHSCLHNK